VTAGVRRLPRLELAILAIALGVLAFLVIEQHRAAERNHVEPDSYSTHDSSSGGYRAWFEMLQREGARVERFELRPVFLDRSIQTLIWADPLAFDDRAEIPSENDVSALQDWVRKGGRLVYLGHDDNAAAQGILKFPHSTRAAANGRPFVAAQLAAAGVKSYPALSSLRWQRGKRTVLLADPKGVLILSYRYGKGEVVAAIDEPSFTNANIGRPDFGRLAYALAQPRRGTTIAFNESVHGFVTPEHWWAVVPRPFAIAIWCALVILLGAFAGAALRLGPPVIPQPGEPNSAAFLDALAALFERGRSVRKALLDAAGSAKRSAARALGLPDDTASDRVAAAIEEPGQRRLFLELERISTNGSPNETNLVRGVALAQRLRKEWTTHGRPRY
jgi:hypothetical protein